LVDITTYRNYSMNNKLTKYITALVMLTTFTLTNVIPAQAAQSKGDSQITKSHSKPTKKTNKRIKSHSYKKVVKTKSKVATANSRIKFKLSLSTAIPKIGADYSYDSGYTGQGSYVVVIDTGVEKAHPFLAGKIALEACFATSCPNGTTQMIGPGAAAPVHYHGTHVAGIIAGSNSQFHGIAPGAKIIAINIFDAYGAAYDDDMVKALNYVYSLADTYNISSVNMSLGGNTVFKSTCDSYLPDVTDAINNLKSKNIATVIAAGNNYSEGMSAPACISSAVSVAATYTSSDKVTDFSNVSKFTTLSAPGYNINSSKLMGSYGSASGTSMATPFVTGALAVYRSKFGVQSVDKVISDFQSTSSPAVDDFTGIVTKRINMKSLIDSTTTPLIPPVVTTTLPVSTTTTLPSTTTVPTTTTATTVPVTTTLPPSPTGYAIGKPLLVSLDSMSSVYNAYLHDVFTITYLDVYYGKDVLTHYLLTCDSGQTFTIPVDYTGRLNYYRLKNSDGTYAKATGITKCYLQGAVGSFLGPKSWWEDINR
jgi:subtilisin family serine protease